MTYEYRSFSHDEKSRLPLNHLADRGYVRCARREVGSDGLWWMYYAKPGDANFAIAQSFAS